ncbi:uncharacterized protein LOC135157745 [Lytechinus pictus]|uniref:uncharacterized protein LOC135157745 n=1 Tax=Lytechinus pictus TaxID=7653 RepID=UPI0030B9C625
MYVFTAILVIYGSMFLIGVPANGFLIWVYYKMSKMRRRAGQMCAFNGFTSTDLLLLGLAAIDFTACVTAPFNVGFSIINKDWRCKYVYIMSRHGCLSALFMTVAVAVYRYHIILYGVKPWSRSPWIIGLVFTLCIVLAFLTHSGVLLYAEYRVGVCLPFGNRRQGLWIYRGFVVGLYFACLTTVLGLYGKIIWFLRRCRSRYIHPVGSLDDKPKELDCEPKLETKVAIACSEDPMEPSTSKNTAFIMDGAKSEGKSESKKIDALTTNRAEINHVNRDGKTHVTDPTASKDVPTVPETLHAKSKQFTDDVVTQQRLVKVRVKRNDHVKATKMVMILTLIIYLAWLPYVISSLLGEQIQYFLRENDQSLVAPLVGVMAFLVRLREVVHVANLFVYVASNDRFRKACKKILESTVFSKCLR